MPTIFWVCIIGFIIAIACYVIMEFCRPYPPGTNKEIREARRTDRLEQRLIDHRISQDIRIAEREEKNKEAAN